MLTCSTTLIFGRNHATMTQETGQASVRLRMTFAHTHSAQHGHGLVVDAEAAAGTRCSGCVCAVSWDVAGVCGAEGWALSISFSKTHSVVCSLCVAQSLSLSLPFICCWCVCSLETPLTHTQSKVKRWKMPLLQRRSNRGENTLSFDVSFFVVVVIHR